jgi:uncharacterized protein
MKNSINWFEIPVKDFDRARAFYSTLFGAEINEMPAEMTGNKFRYAFLPADLTDGVGGAIIESEGYAPSQTGVLIYLNGGDDLNGPLAKVEKAGGSVLIPKTSLGPNGFMAQFMDTEGNKLALHSKN